MNKFNANQKFVSAHELQANFAKIAKKAEKEGLFYQVLRHNEPRGVYLPQKLWEWFLSVYKDEEGDYRKAFVKKVFGAAKERPVKKFAGKKDFLREIR